MIAETDLVTSRPRVSRSVIASFITRASVRSGLGWGAIFGLYVTTQAFAYAASYKRAGARHLLIREFSHNVGISALVGPAREIGTVPGYTAWRCLTVLAIIGSVWAILTCTKHTRAEEDAGRWELFLVGQTTRRQAATEAMVGLGAGLLALFGTTALITIAVGHSSRVDIAPSSGAFFALALVSGALMFMGVGMLFAQLANTRRQAAGIAATVLGASYALRMVADSSGSLAWLRWATPLGWVENLQPLTSPRPLALLPIVALSIALWAGVLYVAGRRDLGAGVLADHSTVEHSRSLPTNPIGLAAFLSRSVLIGWTAAIVGYGLVLGGIAKSGGKIITSSPTLAQVFRRLGVSGADAYLSVALLVMAVVLAFVAIGQVSAARREESTGELDNLLVHPYSRTRWFTQRFIQGTMAILVGGLLVGATTWLGARLDHASVGLSSMLNAGTNVAVPALLLLGIGLLALGFFPCIVGIVTYGLLVWFFLIEILSSVVKLNHWIVDLSAFHQMAAAPAAHIAWGTNGVMIGLALASVALGEFAFARRDLTGD